MNRDKKPPVITQVHVSKTENPLGSCSIMNDVKKSEEAVPYPRDNRCPRNSNVRSSSFTATILLLRWWLPELFASCLSILSFISLIILVNNYQGRPIQDTNLPPSLTLNGLIALLSTIVRASLMVPVGSALSQVIWLSLCSKGGRRVVDLECADGASRGSWGSLLWLLRAKRG